MLVDQGESDVVEYIDHTRKLVRTTKAIFPLRLLLGLPPVLQIIHLYSVP
jgi:hypothetical protein